MDTQQTVLDYIITEESSFKTTRIPLTTSKDWSMHEHIERCTNVANGWFHKGKNDGERPYKDIVTPIINVAFRSEGFDVKDIIPFVDNIENSYKSFLVKKYHPKWARKNGIDTFIDEVVESSIIYDLVLIKNINNVRPQVVPLQEIAFCDQTNILSGPICLKHQYSTSELQDFKGRWNDNKIEEAIVMGKESKTVSTANDQKAKTPGKYVEVYELHGSFPESWYIDGGDPDTYVNQMHIVTYYTSSDNKKHGITLFKGRESKPIFKALKIDSNVKAFGRACGRSIVEMLFEPQVWTNYSGIRLKEMLDAAALNLYQTESDELASNKLGSLKVNSILKHEQGKPLSRVDTSAPNVVPFVNQQAILQEDARTMGSASEPQLGKSPTSGTPFALQNLIVQQGEGFHEYRQGKIAAFFGDQLYPDWILKFLVKEINKGIKFSEDLSLDELQVLSDIISKNEVESKIKKQILDGGRVPTREERAAMVDLYRKNFMKQGSKRFFKTLEGELEDIPVDVAVNVAGKQRYMAQNADKITNIIREIVSNPSAFVTIPGLGKAFNQLLEESGMSPIDFSQLVEDVKTNQPAPVKMVNNNSPVGGEELKEEQK